MKSVCTEVCDPILNAANQPKAYPSISAADATSNARNHAGVNAHGPCTKFISRIFGSNLTGVGVAHIVRPCRVDVIHPAPPGLSRSGNPNFELPNSMTPDAANSDLSMPLVSQRSVPSTSNVRRAVTTAVLGQILEWYDFFLYGTAAALVFGKLFFPIGSDPLTGTIAAFGGFTVGFIARPIGGVLCGHIGDRYGRKVVMMLTLFTMGAATALMGMLPTYQQIGIAAPILLVLLHILQGLAAGGEWS